MNNLILSDTDRHTRLVKQVRKTYQADNPGSRLWPNTSGVAWQGEIIHRNGLNIIKHLRPIFFGIPAPKKKGEDSGGADLLGITIYHFLQDMTECYAKIKVPVFTAIECKTGNARLKKNQKNFRAWVLSVNGIYYLARECQTCADVWEPVKIAGVIVDWIIPLCKSCGGKGYFLNGDDK